MWSKTSRGGKQGPSPLTRGKLAEDRHNVLHLGTIPAHAGETDSHLGTRIEHGDHPRSRGGNRAMPSGTSFQPGPSPLTRGKPGLESGRAEHQRTIPAHAGETGLLDELDAANTDHPRSRGGNALQATSAARSRGPSPLTRGKPLLISPANGESGTIPAHAGETLVQGVVKFLRRDHPRSRGGNGCYNRAPFKEAGPSPLTRGKRKPEPINNIRIRTIPAHAGETRWERIPPRACWDHPRSRGGNLGSNAQVPNHMGPSPLTRGKHPRSSRPDADAGTIPAHAGETCRRAWISGDRGDHPRSRGGNVSSHSRTGSM